MVACRLRWRLFASEANEFPSVRVKIRRALGKLVVRVGNTVV